MEPRFIESVVPEEGHALLSTRASWTKLLMTLPKQANSVAAKLEEKWGSKKDHTTPEEKWEELKAALLAFIAKAGNAKAAKNLSNADRARIENWAVETVFKYVYPRLDINVSKMQNHLLKSPFCVHPKTGRVCVPIEVANFTNFDPFQVPTLGQLMKELDEFEATDDKSENDNDITFDWQKTSLKEPFEKFQKSFLVPLLNEERRMQREEREKRAAVMGDF